METMYVTFHKGPSSAYDPAQHAGGIYQCTDTQDTWVFGVKNSGAAAQPAANVIPLEEMQAANGTLPEETMAKIEDSAQRGTPLFARSSAGNLYPLFIYSNNSTNICVGYLGCFVVGTDRFSLAGTSILVTKATRAYQHFMAARNL